MTNTTTNAAEARANLAERIHAAVTYQYMPMQVRKLLSEAADTLATAEAASGAGEREDVKAMVGRFLAWPLPADFAPDNGISATRPNYGEGVEWRPIGTNLLTAAQAEAMIRYLLGEVAA